MARKKKIYVVKEAEDKFTKQWERLTHSDIFGYSKYFISAMEAEKD